MFSRLFCYITSRVPISSSQASPVMLVLHNEITEIHTILNKSKNKTVSISIAEF
jgi:hypothetical protein